MSNIIPLFNKRNELIDSIQEVLYDAERGDIVCIAQCFVTMEGGVVITAAGKLDIEKLLAGLSEITTHLICLT